MNPTYILPQLFFLVTLGFAIGGGVGCLARGPLPRAVTAGDGAASTRQPVGRSPRGGSPMGQKGRRGLHSGGAALVGVEPSSQSEV